MFFAKSTGGFYSREIHGDNMPDDVMEITEAEHADLMQGQSTGQQIVANARGLPALADRPVPPRADLVAQTLAKARELRSPIMGVLDGMQVSALTLGNTLLAQSIEAAKQGLRDLTKIDFSALTSQAQMAQAVYVRYATIAAAAPPAVHVAFAEVLE